MVKDIEMVGQNFENASEFWMKTKLVSSELSRPTRDQVSYGK